MKNALIFLGLLFAFVSCSAQQKEKLSPNEFQEKYQNETNDFLILDVRTDEEVAEGKVPGAVQMDFYSDEFESKLNALNKETTYYVYCRSGNRSGKAIAKMKAMGIQNVYDMDGGMMAWKSAGLPTE